MTSLILDPSDLFEKTIESSHAERWTRMGAAVPSITTAKESPPPTFLPYLVYEYGLGMLTPYVTNLYDVIDAGVRWHRLRGTYTGVAQGLSFVGVTATVEPAWHGRAWWNSAQLRFPSLPANDVPLLGAIEGITGLSLPFRSDFRRGVFDYDIQPAEADGAMLDESHIEEESGVRLSATGAVWSFGRTAEFDHLLSEAEGTAIGNWIAIPAEGGGVAWASMTYLWSTANFLWSANADAQRRALMAAWFAGREIYVAFLDSDDEVIGYRKAKACHPVSADFDGPYSVDGQAYAPASGGQRVYIEAMTDFEDAFDVTAESVVLVVNVTRAAGVPSGQLWLEPSEITSGDFFASKTVSIPLRKTVRDRVKYIVRF